MLGKNKTLEYTQLLSFELTPIILLYKLLLSFHSPLHFSIVLESFRKLADRYEQYRSMDPSALRNLHRLCSDRGIESRPRCYKN